MPIKQVRYKCDNCFDFDLCECCYQLYGVQKRELKTVYSTSHKNYHNFTKIILAADHLPIGGAAGYNDNSGYNQEEDDVSSAIIEPHSYGGGASRGRRAPGRPPASSRGGRGRGRGGLSLTQRY